MEKISHSKANYRRIIQASNFMPDCRAYRRITKASIGEDKLQSNKRLWNKEQGNRKSSKLSRKLNSYNDLTFPWQFTNSTSHNLHQKKFNSHVNLSISGRRVQYDNVCMLRQQPEYERADDYAQQYQIFLVSIAQESFVHKRMPQCHKKFPLKSHNQWSAMLQVGLSTISTYAGWEQHQRRPYQRTRMHG